MSYISPWRMAAMSKDKVLDACERCKGEVDFSGDTKLCCVDAHICRACKRDWEIDKEARSLTVEKNVAYIRGNACVEAGNPDAAEAEYRRAAGIDETLLQYTLKWLTSYVPPAVTDDPSMDGTGKGYKSEDKPVSNGHVIITDEDDDP